jgi:hypothetical protein
LNDTGIKPLVVLLLTLFQFGCGEIQQLRFEGGQGSLSGKVVDQQGIGSPAILGLFYENPAESFRLVSQADGRFVFNNIPVGDPFLMAADLDGNRTQLQVLVCGDENNDIGILRLDKNDNLTDKSERQLTFGRPVLNIHLSRSGKSIAYQVYDEELSCHPPDTACRWSLLQETEEGSWNSIGTFETVSTVLGLDDSWVYLMSYADWKVKLLRMKVDNPDIIQSTTSFERINCFGQISAFGIVFWTNIYSQMPDTSAHADLLIWRPEDQHISTLVANIPNGIMDIEQSPDGTKVVYTPYNTYNSNQRIIFDLGTETQNTETIKPDGTIINLEFDPYGKIASLDIDSSGKISFRLDPITKRVVLPIESDGDLDVFSDIKYDPSRHDWYLNFSHKLIPVDVSDYLRFFINVENMTVTNTTTEPQNVGIWKVNSFNGNIAIESPRNPTFGYNDIFIDYFNSQYPLTTFNDNSQYDLLGWSSDGQSVIYIKYSQMISIPQIYSIRIPKEL